MDAYILRIGYFTSCTDENLYIKIVKNERIIIIIYVDDLFVIGVECRIIECNKMLAAEFEMKDRGLMHYNLGLEVWKKLNEIYLGQVKQ